ncbi:hybrid sensor histidine kinase/response regulator [Shewanella olleyana]|uniref:ATP-binding response regulator n=1 Tax=Shewanella olleyana TaxID=135626 RepID=UPI002010142D|nr:hybrid sensor histidine kinase/response regulator [Shewanella olleyana]MCL1066306.1 hybrid sensor histidine kinase/response regulator [Shewanella olleyana]
MLKRIPFLFLFFGLFFTVYVTVSEFNFFFKDLNSRHQLKSNKIFESIDDMFLQHALVIHSLQSFLNSSENVTKSDFHSFSKKLLKRKAAFAFTLTPNNKVFHISDKKLLSKLNNLTKQVNADGITSIYFEGYTVFTFNTQDKQAPILAYAVSHERILERFETNVDLCIEMNINEVVLKSQRCLSNKPSAILESFKVSDINFNSSSDFLSKLNPTGEGYSYNIKTNFYFKFDLFFEFFTILLLIFLLGVAMSTLLFIFVRNRTLIDSINASNRSKIALLSTINHEVRTPINAILAYANLLQEQSNKSIEQSKIINKLSWAANLLKSVADNTLAYSKAETGTLSLNNELINIKEFISKIQDYYVPISLTTNKKLILKVSDELPDCINIDITKFFQLLTNLVNNSFKYSTGETIELHIDLYSKVNNNSFLRILVKDYGKGMPEEYRTILSNPFISNTTPTTSGNVGIGLGLFTCKRIVDFIGGKFRLSSHLDEGTQILVRFPCFLSNHEVIDVAEYQGYKVLMVDDNPFNLEAGRVFLKSHQFEVTTASNEFETLNALSKSWAQIIIVDYRLIETDGLSLISKIRSLFPNMEAIYFILSANDKDEIEGFDSITDVGFLQKPLNIDIFYSHLMRARLKEFY